jgi:hypothetical protein
LTDIKPSYSTAINKLSEKHLSSSRSVLRLRRIEEELTEHLAVLQHESALIKQSGFFFPPLCYFLKYISFFSWNKALLPSDAESESASALKDVPVLEKQREVMLRKAKEYHRGVERMTVRFGGSSFPLLFFLFFFFPIVIHSLMYSQKERPIDLRITLAQLISQKEKNLSREKDIEEKRARLRAFQGLPPVRPPSPHIIIILIISFDVER